LAPSFDGRTSDEPPERNRSKRRSATSALAAAAISPGPRENDYPTILKF
jgi:hypothetical protein